MRWSTGFPSIAGKLVEPRQQQSRGGGVRLDLADLHDQSSGPDETFDFAVVGARDIELSLSQPPVDAGIPFVLPHLSDECFGGWHVVEFECDLKQLPAHTEVVGTQSGQFGKPFLRAFRVTDPSVSGDEGRNDPVPIGRILLEQFLAFANVTDGRLRRGWSTRS